MDVLGYPLKVGRRMSWNAEQHWSPSGCRCSMCSIAAHPHCRPVYRPLTITEAEITAMATTPAVLPTKVIDGDGFVTTRLARARQFVVPTTVEALRARVDAGVTFTDWEKGAIVASFVPAVTRGRPRKGAPTLAGFAELGILGFSDRDTLARCRARFLSA